MSKHPIPPRFRIEEIASATKLPVTGIEFLVKCELVPPSKGGGRGNPRTFDTNGLAEFAICGALYWAGADIVVASKVSRAFANEWKAKKGYLPDSLDNIWRDLASDSRDNPNKLSIEGDVEDRYHYLMELGKCYPSFLPKEPQKNADLILHIVDREYVLSSILEGTIKTQSPYTGATYLTSSEYRLLGWSRGVKNIELKMFYDEPNDTIRLAKIEREFQLAYQNSVSSLVINTSLAVRKVYQSIADSRLNGPAVSRRHKG
jgi:hypothetical protein